MSQLEKFAQFWLWTKMCPVLARSLSYFYLYHSYYLLDMSTRRIYLNRIRSSKIDCKSGVVLGKSTPWNSFGNSLANPQPSKNLPHSTYQILDIPLFSPFFRLANNSRASKNSSMDMLSTA